MSNSTITPTLDQQDDELEPIVELPEQRGQVTRLGVGYCGSFPRGFTLSLESVRRSRGDLSGVLDVSNGERHLARARFNVSSLTSRGSMARYLKGRTANYDGWPAILEDFCRQVDVLDAEGQPFERLTPIGPDDAALPEYLVDPIIPLQRPTLIFGPPGAHKSTVAAAVAVAVGTGENILGWRPRVGPVLVLDWETDRDEWRRRIGQLARGAGASHPDHFYRRCAQPLYQMIESVAAFVQREEVRLVIVDSVGPALGADRDGGDANETTLRLFAALRAIGTTSLLIDQVKGENTDNERTGHSRPYGSVFKTFEARSVFELRCEEQPEQHRAELLLKQVKVNESSRLADQGIEVTRADGAIRLRRCEVTAPDLEPHAGTTADRMRRLLRSGPMSMVDIVGVLEVKRNTVSQVVKRNRHFHRLNDGRIGLAG